MLNMISLIPKILKYGLLEKIKTVHWTLLMSFEQKNKNKSKIIMKVDGWSWKTSLFYFPILDIIQYRQLTNGFNMIIDNL